MPTSSNWNVEKVVSAPRNPEVIPFLSSGLFLKYRIAKEPNKPIKNAPIIFAINVPDGNPSLVFKKDNR